MTRSDPRDGTSIVALALCAAFLLTGSLFADVQPATWSVVGDFDGDGKIDRLSAHRGSETLILTPGDGAGGFLSPRSRTLAGAVTALAVGEVNRRDGLIDLAVAINGLDGPSVLVFESPAGAFVAEPERFELPAVATLLMLGRFNDDPFHDLGIAVADELLMVEGRDRRLSWQSADGPVPAARVQRMPLGSELDAAPPDQGQRTGSSLFAVSSSGDESDLIPGDGVCESVVVTCTLRAAIEEANASGGLDVISFTAAVAAPIALAGPLTVTDPVTLDGTSHPSFAGSPVVVLAVGFGGGSAINLVAGSDGSTVRALVIHGAPEAGVRISGSGGNTVAGNYLGTDASGTLAVGNGDGIKIVGSGVGNVLGGTAAGDGNLISGNTGDGIELETSTAITDTLIQGNLIGTDVSGLLDLGNGEHGVHLGSPSGTTGGTTAAARNLIAYNGMHGVFVRRGDNLVQGNWIGIVADGSAAGNLGDGVHFGGPGSGDSTIGGTAPGAGNVISANVGDGVRFGIGADNLVQGNLIGTDPTGLLDRGNGGFGICDGCSGGFRNIIGGSVAGAGNVISANTLDGYATGTFDGVVQGNTIGLASDGEGLLGNGGVGVAGSDTVVGGSDPLAGNLVSANVGAGVRVGTDASVLGNRIGVTTSGGAAGNGGAGIHVLGGARVAVGGTSTGEGNLVAFNSGDGVAVTDFGLLNRISGNAIFGNAGLGIDIDDDGVTANDSGDADAGTNDLQNFPVLTSADGGLGTVIGVLDGAAGLTHTIEVFSSPDCDASGHGEGRIFLGSGMVTTSGAGDVGFTVTVTTPFFAGAMITATATNPAGSTSEFSACLEAVVTPVPIFSDGFESGDTSAWS